MQTSVSIRKIDLVWPDDAGYRAFVETKQAEQRRASEVRRALASTLGAPLDQAGLPWDGVTGYCRAAATEPEITASLPVTGSDRPELPKRTKVGRYVEGGFRHILGQSVQAQGRRILRWEEVRRCGEVTVKYKECDGVWQVGATYVLFEVKATTPERMREHVGQSQLDRARAVLTACPGVRRVLRRLVYVGGAPDRYVDDVPSVRCDDLDADLGVIWLDPDSIDRAHRAMLRPTLAGWREAYGLGSARQWEIAN